MTCPHCHSRELVEIRMQLHAEGGGCTRPRPASVAGGTATAEAVGLTSVLDLVAVR